MLYNRNFKSKTKFDKDKKIWYGEKVEPLFNSNLSAGEVVIAMLNRDGNKVVQISANNGVELTGNQLSDLSIRCAINLQKKGLKQEDVIGIIASNSQYLAPLVFGSFLCGTPINSLDPSFNKAEIKHMFGITRPKIIFCDALIYYNVQDALKEISLSCPVYIIKGVVNNVETIQEFLKETEDESQFLPPRLIKGAQQTAAILCSSGTTGLPKGVCLSHETILEKTFFPNMNNSISLGFSTLYWLSGLMMLMSGTISGSKRIIVDEPFAPELFLKIVEKYKVNFVFTPPSQMGMLINHPDIKKTDLSSIKCYMCGGSLVPTKVVKEMQKYLPTGSISIGYGMTEIGGTCSIEGINKKEGSVGQVSSNIKIRVVDEDGKNLDVGQDGEIFIKTNLKWFGYFNNEKETKKTLDDEGWIHSGDIGHFDEDGFLFLIDRKKEILKYKNFHFFPSEIEDLIRQLPDVADVSVCGIPDIIATDLPAAAIVKKKNSNLTSKDVYDYVANNMAHFKHLHGGVYFVDSLPMTASGKVQRRKVRDILENLRRHNG